MTVNHDAVGSSPTGGAIQALQSQCFFVAQNTLTLNFEVGGKACDAPSVAKKRTGFGAAVGFLREYEQKKTGTASGCVTRLTIELV